MYCVSCPTDSTTQWSSWSTTCGDALRTRAVTNCSSLGLPSTIAACDQKCARQPETERRDDTTAPCPCSGSSLTLNSTTQQNISCGHNLPACSSGSFCEAANAVCCNNCPVARTTAGQWGAWSASCGYATRTRVDYVCAAVAQGYYSGCHVVCQSVNVYDKRSIACPFVPYPAYPSYPSCPEPAYPSYPAPAPAPSYPSYPAPAPSYPSFLSPAPAYPTYLAPAPSYPSYPEPNSSYQKPSYDNCPEAGTTFSSWSSYSCTCGDASRTRTKTVCASSAIVSAVSGGCYVSCSEHVDTEYKSLPACIHCKTIHCCIANHIFTMLSLQMRPTL